MNCKAYAIILALISLPLGFLTGCGGSGGSSGSGSSNSSSSAPTAQVVGIVATSGSPQSAPVGQKFTAPLTATVTTSGVGTSGEKVTFTAPASGASGTFANGTATETDITDNLGVATSSAFSANATAGTYKVTATVSGAAASVSFRLTNIGVTPVVATAYSFYLSGEDVTENYYALAGSVLIDPTGKVLAGEQDYNDGAGGIASPEPMGDQIIGGMLTFPAGAPPGQGTLTVNTNNPNLGLNANGIEVFGVQFVNPSHALIMQFDGFATSSGSMDVQTLPSTLSGSYAFAVSGFDSSDTPVAYGGVFSINGTNLSNGIIDINDAENLGVTTGTAFSGTISAADSFGRGTITGFKVGGTAVSLNYYVVSPKAIRVMDVDVGSDAAVGSAFGQGTGTFSNASLGTSVFTVAGTQLAQFAGLGQFTTSNTSSSPADFSGVGDDNEPENGVISPPASKISGTYSIASNGYGSLTFNLNSNSQGLGDITALGVYMTDPTLNLNDPNNPTGGGGALVVDLDSGDLTGVPLPGGTGVIVPQTDAATATTDFAGNYAAGWQNFDNGGCGCEFDMIAQGTMVANGALSLTGLVSDPFFSLGTPNATSSGNTFTGTPLADTKNPGRYTLNSLATMIDGGAGPTFDMVIYQASGGQLFWLDYDNTLTTVSIGPLEQQGSLTGLPAIAIPAAKSRTKRTH